MPLYASFGSALKKYHFFACTTIINAKNYVWKSDVSTFTFFGPLHSQNKDIALKFCMRVVYMFFDNMHSGFLDDLKVWI